LEKNHTRGGHTSQQTADVCDGVLDDLIEKAKRILDGETKDNGFLPFICMIDDEKEVHDEECWYKANPSLQYLPNLLERNAQRIC